MKWLRLTALAVCVITSLFAQRVGAPTDDLTKLGVDELFSLEVTSVGRKAQELSKAPAAVFVVTAEDIRRSGATSIPEALRWVPGLTVLSQDGRSWDISARGSTRLYSDKILVMIDGRSLYTPLFSGVIWESVDVPLARYRTNRSRARPRRRDVGAECRQWRHQYHYQARSVHTWETSQRGSRQPAARRRGGAHRSSLGPRRLSRLG